MYSPCLVSVDHLAYFVVFLGFSSLRKQPSFFASNSSGVLQARNPPQKDEIGQMDKPGKVGKFS